MWPRRAFVGRLIALERGVIGITGTQRRPRRLLNVYNEPDLRPPAERFLLTCSHTKNTCCLLFKAVCAFWLFFFTFSFSLNVTRLSRTSTIKNNPPGFRSRRLLWSDSFPNGPEAPAAVPRKRETDGNGLQAFCLVLFLPSRWMLPRVCVTGIIS